MQYDGFIVLASLTKSRYHEQILDLRFIFGPSPRRVFACCCYCRGCFGEGIVCKKLLGGTKMRQGKVDLGAGNEV